jgi:hypothetical protein
MLGHLRMEAYPHYRRSIYPGALTSGAKVPTLAGNERAIAAGKERWEHPGERPA